MNTASTTDHCRPPAYTGPPRVDTLIQILDTELTLKDVDAMPRNLRQHLNSLLSHWEQLTQVST